VPACDPFPTYSITDVGRSARDKAATFFRWSA